MKKRLLSLLLTVVMVLGMLPVGVLADDGAEQTGLVQLNEPAAEPASVTVSFTAQAEGAFLCAPQLEVEVTGDLAEGYGYTDSIDAADGVTALDVLVKAHELIFGEVNTDVLVVPDSGYITTIFGTETSANGFIVNGGFPNDGTPSPYGGYNGTTVTTHQVADGDFLEFFVYQDQQNWSDRIVWFAQNGQAAECLTARPQAEVLLALHGLMYMNAYLYRDAEALRANGVPVSNAQLAWIEAETGALEVIDDAVTDPEGKVTVTMPADEGTYRLTAYAASDGDSPIILGCLPVTVDADAPVTQGSSKLAELKVMDFNNMVADTSLALTPAFDGDVTVYTTDPLPYTDSGHLLALYLKATAEDADASISASIHGETKVLTSGMMGNFQRILRTGDNVLAITVTNGESVTTYTVTIPMAPDPTAPTLKGEAEAEAAIRLGETYTLDLTTVFDDADNPQDLAYKVQVDDAQAEAADGQYALRPTAPGVYTLAFTANDGKNDSPVYTVTLTVTAPDASITVPADAELFVGSKTKHFVAFTEVPAAVEMENGDGTTTYYFELQNGSTYNYRVGGEGYVTYAGTFRKTANDALTITADQLQPADKSAASVDHDVHSNNGYNVGDLYLNINPQGHLRLDRVGDTYQLVHLRNWEAVDSITNNYFIEPDYHYAVLDMDGEAGSGVVTVSDSGVVTAVGEGTAIVLVTYDAIHIAGAAGGPFFGAIWPENTGVFVVSVGAQESGIETGMTIHAGKNSTVSKLSGDALDAEHDVIYFLGDQGAYTFTPGTTGVHVSVANPIVGDSMTFSGFTPVDAGRDGSFTVPLTEGRNIVRLEKDGASAYQIITAKAVTVTVNGQPLEEASVTPGEALTIGFDTLYHPANKLASVYNMSACILYSDVDGYAGSIAGGAVNQYQFASKEAAQTVAGFVKRTVNNWGLPSYTADKSAALAVPADWTEDTFTLSGGTLVALGYGDPYGGHRAITLTDGKGPNFNAMAKEAYLGQLPDIVLSVTETKQVESIEITTQPAKTEYFAGDAFVSDGMTVKAVYTDGTVCEQVKSYTVSPAVLTADTQAVTVTYGGKTASVPVTVTLPRATAIAVSKAPDKTSYTAGQTFNPTGMVVRVTYENGTERETTAYTYAPNRALQVEDRAMTITYTGDDAAEVLTAQQAIEVLPGAPEEETPDTITVYFKLLGDDHHDSDSDGRVHTLLGGGLTTWIARTRITVDRGATVLDVTEKALGLHGIPFENTLGNYISSIRGLGEQDNGVRSGWMYTLNGSHPELGVAEQVVQSGDSIVFHYTDDYAREEGSEIWGGEDSGSTADKPDPKPVKPVTPAVSFTDVEGHWGSDAIDYISERGLMEGVGDGHFDPDGTLTRAMLVTILWRMEESPAKGGAMPYGDVPADMWYTEAVRWAAAQGIINGVGDGRFDPDGQITREQIAAMLWRYARYKKIDLPAGAEASLTGYTDASHVSAYAAPAMQWACSAGLIQGREQESLAPLGSATRAEAATILMRYLTSEE